MDGNGETTICVCVCVKIWNHQTETTIHKNCCLGYQVGVLSDPKPPKMLVSHSDIVSILTLSPWYPRAADWAIAEMTPKQRGRKDATSYKKMLLPTSKCCAKNLLAQLPNIQLVIDCWFGLLVVWGSTWVPEQVTIQTYFFVNQTKRASHDFPELLAFERRPMAMRQARCKPGRAPECCCWFDDNNNNSNNRNKLHQNWTNNSAMKKTEKLQLVTCNFRKSTHFATQKQTSHAFFVGIHWDSIPFGSNKWYQSRVSFLSSNAHRLVWIASLPVPQGTVSNARFANH